MALRTADLTPRRPGGRLAPILGGTLLLLLAQLVLAAPAQAGQIGVTISIQGAGKVVVVEGSIEDFASGICDKTTNQNENQTESCPRFRNEETFEAWVWLRATPATTPAGNWSFDAWSGCHQTRLRDGFTECGVKSGAFSNVEAIPKAYFEDVVDPTVDSLAASPSAITEKTYAFSFTTSDNLAECRVGTNPFAPCTSPQNIIFSTEGSRTFEVRALDPSGQKSATSSKSVTVVDTAITSGPAGTVSSRTATFNFTSQAGITFKCKLDNQVAHSCNSGTATYSFLADGPHSFAVFAENGEFWDPVPVTRSWTVDATPPDTAIGTVQQAGADASFAFTGSGGASWFECKLDGPAGAGTWSSCSSPKSYTGLADGSHTFSVRAMDWVGNTDASPDTRTWTVDTTAPDTTVSSGPRHDGFLLSPDAVVQFGSTEAASTFSCTLDASSVPCPGGGLTLSGLSRTTHVVTGAATDAKGNTDSTVAERRWTVPLDNAELLHGRGWTQKLGATAYLGTFSQSKTKGATLSRMVTGARTLGVVVSKAPGYGKVQVFAGAQLVKTFTTAATTPKSKQVVTVPLATPFTGKVRIVVATTDKVVRIDGLGVATGG